MSNDTMTSIDCAAELRTCGDATRGDISACTFEMPAQIIWHSDAIGQLGCIASDLRMSHVYLVLDECACQAGLADAAIRALKAAQIEVTMYTDAVAHTPEGCIMQAASLGRQACVDGVIGIGGQAALDTSKLIALLACAPRVLNDLQWIDQEHGTRLPLVQVPVGAACGIAVSSRAVMTSASRERYVFASPKLSPDVVLVDSGLAMVLSPEATAMTALDLLVQAIETLTANQQQKKNLLSDDLALKATQMIYRNVQAVIRRSTDVMASEQIAMASLFVGMALSQPAASPLQALVAPLGVRFHVSQEAAHVLMLPHWLKYNRVASQATYAKIGRALHPELIATPNHVAASAFVDTVSHLISQMPCAQCLREVGVTRSDLPILAKEAMSRRHVLASNPREIGYQNALALYADAY